MSSSEQLSLAAALGRCAWQVHRGNLAEAAHQLRGLTELYPNNPEPAMMLGEALFKMRHFEAAYGAFEDASRRGAGNRANERRLDTAIEMGDVVRVGAVLKERCNFDADTRGLRALRLGKHVQFVDLKLASNAILHGLLSGFYESDERRILNGLLDENDRVLEIGAAIGAVSVAIGSIVGGEALLCVEPNPRLHPALKATLAANAISAQVIEGAVVSEGTFQREGAAMSLRLGHEFWGSSLTDDPGGEVIEVPVHSVDALIRDHGANAVVVDIEGGELDLIMNSPLEGVRKLAVEVHPLVIGEDGVVKVLDRLASLGFRIAIPARQQVVARR
ncbi:MAG: FkbM family methyltransferase [Hyphomicrobiaceae bacterium]